jgi:DNA-binding NarL/FixJ family response regulator
MSKVKVLLVDDHGLVREGIKMILERERHFEVVGEATDGRKALAALQKVRPDVILMDISMPNLNGFEAIFQIKRSYPDAKILVLTVHTNEEYVYKSLKAGALGYLVKDSAVSELVGAVKAVAEGKPYLSPSISKGVVDRLTHPGEMAEEDSPLERLTPREREILQLIGEGKNYHQIADILSISYKTVENHRSNIVQKLNVRERAQLVRYAIELGLVGEDSIGNFEKTKGGKNKGGKIEK